MHTDFALFMSGESQEPTFSPTFAPAAIVVRAAVLLVAGETEKVGRVVPVAVGNVAVDIRVTEVG